MIVRKDGEEADIQIFNNLQVKNIVGQKSTNYDSVIDQIKGVNHATPRGYLSRIMVLA